MKITLAESIHEQRAQLAGFLARLPEVRDVDKPKLVFFFDEALPLFADASKDFLAAITQTDVGVVAVHDRGLFTRSTFGTARRRRR